jgi:hypothetical protein
MFSLILTIVAVALVTALALATIYYGGSALKNHGTKAQAAQVVNEGQQISAAVDLYRTNNSGALPASMDTLTAGGTYLSSRPNVDWTFSSDYAVYPVADVEVCKKANATMGIQLAEVPMCSAVEGKTICCQKD